MYFGAHVKSSGGVWHAVENGVELGAEAVQFFAGSPRTWAPTLYKEKDSEKFRALRDESPIRFVVIHTIYLINLASENEDFYKKSVKSLCGAVTAAEQLGADAIVTHIGSHQGSGFAAIPQLNPERQAQANANGAMAQMGNLGNTLGTPLLLTAMSAFGYAGLIGMGILCYLGAIATHVALARRRWRLGL